MPISRVSSFDRRHISLGEESPQHANFDEAYPSVLRPRIPLFCLQYQNLFTVRILKCNNRRIESSDRSKIFSTIGSRTQMLQLYLPVLSDSLYVRFTGKKVKCQQHEKLQTRILQRSVNKSSKSMRVNFVYKGLFYDFLLRIGLLLNVGHTAMEKPCLNWEGFKTIFCFFEQRFHALH